MCEPRRLRPTRITQSLALILFIAAISCTWVRAQSSLAQSFDVISVKPNRGENLGTSLSDSLPGKFAARYYSLLWVMEYAYDAKEAQIEGLPAWADSEKYDIDAKMDDATAEQEKSLSREQRTKLTRTRVQSLLADRFALQLHHETKNIPVLELTVAKGGSKLVETPLVPAPGDPHPLPPGSLTMGANAGQWTIVSNQEPLKILVNVLSGQPEVRGRVLLDRTGLTGKYTFKLQWSTQNLSAAPSSDTTGASLFSALEEQIGLRLESAKAPVDVLVVDHVAQPSPN